VHQELTDHGVEVITGTSVTRLSRHASTLRVEAIGPTGELLQRVVDLVLVVVGVRPDTALAAAAGATLGVKGAIAVDERMRTNLPGVYAAGDCVITHHRLLGTTCCHWARPRTSRAESPGRTPSAATAASPGRWVRRS
jgi:NADPH-dependent 2,4-dienoyl-CoA reductase/sulfur reductase-like enzyme